MKKIDRFFGKYRWLSNFWPAQVDLDGVWYPTVEHAYQAAKTLDGVMRAKIAVCSTPGQAKWFSRGIKYRTDWLELRLLVMEDLLRQKFAQGTRLGQQLLATDDLELVEGNTWSDTFWGRCKGVGENHLGKLLMQIRNDLQ